MVMVDGSPVVVVMQVLCHLVHSTHRFTYCTSATNLLIWQSLDMCKKTEWPMYKELLCLLGALATRNRLRLISSYRPSRHVATPLFLKNWFRRSVPPHLLNSTNHTQNDIIRFSGETKSIQYDEERLANVPTAVTLQLAPQSSSALRASVFDHHS